MTLAAPLVVLIVLIGLQVQRASAEAADVAEQTHLARMAIGPSGIITALQDERSWTSTEMIGQTELIEVPVEGYDETRTRTDTAVRAFQDELAARGGAMASAYDEALAGLAALQGLRADVDGATAPRDLSNLPAQDEVFMRYSELVAPFFQGTTRVALEIDDTELREGVELADAVARQVETLSLLVTRTTSATLLSAGPDGLTPEEIRELSGLRSRFRRQAATLSGGTGPYAGLAEEHFPAGLNDRILRNVDNAILTGEIDVAGFLDDLSVSDDEGYTTYTRLLHDHVNRRATDLQDAADARRLRLTILAAVVLLATIGLTVVTSLSITRPLEALTRQARETAQLRLPQAVQGVLAIPLGDDIRVPELEPVAVAGDGEVTDVAEALTTVQGSALALALEQAGLRRNIADSFVNLGRRNQNLLGRQLDFITQLEQRETDPDTLANLFRLDHLATRMRRNAESLLVLADVPPSRRWSEPVALNDLVRAAEGEVEDYQRVHITGLAPALVLGSVAADLIHVVAELLENALTFSAPHQQVEVRGWRHTQTSGYVLTIIDVGVGMTGAEMDRANRRLAGAESFTVAPSKYLGHYVAGHLANRHGIEVQLHPTPGHGTTAALILPGDLLVEPAAAAPLALPAPASAPVPSLSGTVGEFVRLVGQPDAYRRTGSAT